MIANKALDVGQNIATQKVIGYTRTVTRTKGKKNPKTITESMSVGIQAWEIAALIASVGIYDIINGPGGFESWIFSLLGYNPNTGQANPGSLLSISGPSNPAQQASFNFLDSVASGVQGLGGWLSNNTGGYL